MLAHAGPGNHMDYLTEIKRRTANIPEEIVYILSLFIVTRVILTAIGIFSRMLLGGPYLKPLSGIAPLNIWGVWDSLHYSEIASSGYIVQNNIAFFPLYPLLMKLLGVLTGNVFIAGLIISNACLLIACYYFYKLVRMDEDKQTSLDSIKFLFLYPTAFVLSGAFTESLYLALIVACFYYARKDNWALAGTLGLLLAMTRSIGVLVIIPLAYEYLRSKDFKLERLKPDALFLLLIPMGLAAFMAYCYYIRGDFLAFAHIQTSWGREISNPVYELISGLMHAKINAVITVLCLVTLTAFYKKIGFSYWLVGMYSILVPLMTGIGGMHRYTLVIFPLFIIFAKLTKNPQLNQLAVIALALLQGCFMAIWTNEIALE